MLLHLLAPLALACWVCAASSYDPVTLLEGLIAQSNPNVRPVLSVNDTVSLTFGAALYQLVEFDVKAETITLLLWQRMTWNDSYFVWDPAQHGGAQTLRVGFLQMWKPDIMPYNDVGAFNPAKYKETVPITVNHLGEVLWLTPVRIETTCKMDVTAFPFDRHRCPVRVGSWQYRMDEVDIHCENSRFDLSSYKEHSQWKIRDTTCERLAESFQTGSFVSLLFTVEFERLNEFYVKNLILPNAVLLALSSLVFFLPSGMADRASFGITSMLAICVNLMVVTNYVPETSKTYPSICNYFIVSILLSAFSIIVSTMTMHLSDWTVKKGCGRSAYSGVAEEFVQGSFSCKRVAAVLDKILGTAYFVSTTVYSFGFVMYTKASAEYAANMMQVSA